jgi:hypothetical protein
VNSTSITRLHRHLPHHLHREHQQKERKRTETKTSVAIVFVVPRSSDNRLCAEASAPLFFVHLSYQRGRERKHRKRDRKEENKGNEDTDEEPTNEGSGRQKKKNPIASRPGKLSFIPSFCMHSFLKFLNLTWVSGSACAYLD